MTFFSLVNIVNVVNIVNLKVLIYFFFLIVSLFSDTLAEHYCWKEMGEKLWFINLLHYIVKEKRVHQKVWWRYFTNSTYLHFFIFFFYFTNKKITWKLHDENRSQLTSRQNKAGTDNWYPETFSCFNENRALSFRFGCLKLPTSGIMILWTGKREISDWKNHLKCSISDRIKLINLKTRKWNWNQLILKCKFFFFYTRSQAEGSFTD